MVTRLRQLEAHPHFALLRLHKAEQVPREQLAEWGAHSAGIGRKMVRGRPTNRVALLVYVERKVAGRLRSSRLVPARIVAHHPMTGRRYHLNTDVVQLPRARYQGVDPKEPIRPIPGGVSIGVAKLTAGTMGGWVKDTTDGEIVMLSNQHIFLDQAGASVRQQAWAEFGMKASNRVGTVKRSVPITRDNRVDCAVASPAKTSLIDLSVLNVCDGVHEAVKGTFELPVEKFGSTTKGTEGHIRDADWSGYVEKDYFDQCLLIWPAKKKKGWSGPGDSGSLVFLRDDGGENGSRRSVVGLHFAGIGSGGLACRIEHVFEELKVGPVPR